MEVEVFRLFVKRDRKKFTLLSMRIPTLSEDLTPLSKRENYEYFSDFSNLWNASPIVYTAMWILGGILQPDYSHIRDDVSSLFAVGAPNKQLMQSFIITSSVLLFAFYIGLPEGIKDGGGSIVGPILFLTSSVLGILVALFFPLDAGDEIITLRGKMHLILVVGSGILTIAGMVALWFRLQLVVVWSAFATYSLASAIVSFILVIISRIFIKSKYRGLLERLGVTPYQLYYFVLSLKVFLNN